MFVAAAAAAVWTSLFAISHSNVITVNNEGNSSTNCCEHGRCPCGSLSNALQHLKSHTIIHITSQSVPLHGLNSIRHLNRITISGNGATIMCNNSGILYILYCKNVVIEGIIWDQCGNTNQSNSTVGIAFGNITNLAILSSTFQHSGVCIAVFLSIKSGYVEVKNSNFLYNHVANSSRCKWYSSLYCTGILQSTYNFIIVDTTFHHNGEFNNIKNPNNSVLYLYIVQLNHLNIYLVNTTITSSGGLGAYISCRTINTKMDVKLHGVKVVNNSGGGSVLLLNGSPLNLLVNSSTFAYNSNGSLMVVNDAVSSTVWLNEVSVFQNKGTFKITKQPFFPENGKIADEGVGVVLWFLSPFSEVVMSSCNIYNNIGEMHSIVYIDSYQNVIAYQSIAIISSNFTNNIGPALRVSLPTIILQGLIVYQDNSAESGAAIYIEDNTQVAIGKESTILFINNSASLHGGAIYVDLPLTCSHHGVVFTSLPYNSDVVFINNSAGITGNSMYFSIPESCDVIRDYNDSNSIGYIPYHNFSYSDFNGTEISTSPYQINLCSSPGCDSVNTNNCYIQHGNMLGQSVNFNATVCDYFNNVAEAVQFNLDSINYNNTYRLYNNKVLAHDGISEITVLSVDRDDDVQSNINITINMSSLLSPKYKKLTIDFSFELSPCLSGFVFDVGTQQCTCYSDSDIVQCQEDYTEIKQGYWFGNVIETHTVSLCPQYYCEFSTHAETITGFYRLPANQDDQCSPHRRGPACGECSPGYSLSYDTPDCVSNDKCSAGITVLVVVLTVLYWIAVVVVIFVLMYFINNAPIGYAYGIIYYYSIVDILLGNNLYISDGLFQFVSILSSLAKLTPQFLGRLCLVQGLSGIDQHFIRFSHAVIVFVLVVTVVIIVNRSMNLSESKVVQDCIIRVICLLLLLAYTSLATTSLQLLRPLHYQDVDGVYVYLSPSNKYFNGRHIAYAIIAFCIEILVIHGLIFFLLFDRLLQKYFNLIKVKGYLDQVQACYKDGYQWFAAYYLVCRQGVILIVYIISNYDTMLYFLQTFCTITVAIHVCIQPYNSKTLNVIDGVILLTMVLVVNLNTYNFSRSSTIAIIAVLMIFPLLFATIAFLKNKIPIKMPYQRLRNERRSSNEAEN